MEDEQLIWLTVYIVILGIGFITTLLTIVFSFKGLNLRVSAVQYITYALCCAYFAYSLSRFIFFVAVLSNWSGVGQIVDDVKDGQLVGVRVIYAKYSEKYGIKSGIVLLALFGDITLLCITFWMVNMTYEMKRLAFKGVDRGPDREKKIIRKYNLLTYITSVVFATTLVCSAWLAPDKQSKVRSVAFNFQLFCMWGSFFYPLYCAIKISCRNRSVNVVNPASLMIYQRIKRLVNVYCVLVFPACMIQFLIRTNLGAVPNFWTGLSATMYFFSGAGTALVIGVSVTCCYRALQPVMPETVYEQLLENGYFPERMTLSEVPIVEPPLVCPIFVCTDIESSTSLWAADPIAMEVAQSLHDDLLRRKLIKFNGYEITTAGDSFQLAFHHVADAIGWCIQVQEKLMLEDWPEDLLKIEAAAPLKNESGQLMFNGLRVRMAIHNGDSQLVCSKHPTTGKMTYLGVSELIARELGDAGNGGDVLISDSGLKLYEHEKKDKFPKHEIHNMFTSCQVESVFEIVDLHLLIVVYQLQSNVLRHRYVKVSNEKIESKVVVWIRGRNC